MSTRVGNIYEELKLVDRALDVITDATAISQETEGDTLLIDVTDMADIRTIIEAYKEYLTGRLVL